MAESPSSIISPVIHSQSSESHATTSHNKAKNHAMHSQDDCVLSGLVLDAITRSGHKFHFFNPQNPLTFHQLLANIAEKKSLNSPRRNSAPTVLNCENNIDKGNKETSTQPKDCNLNNSADDSVTGSEEHKPISSPLPKKSSFLKAMSVNTTNHLHSIDPDLFALDNGVDTELDHDHKHYHPKGKESSKENSKAENSADKAPAEEKDEKEEENKAQTSPKASELSTPKAIHSISHRKHVSFGNSEDTVNCEEIKFFRHSSPSTIKILVENAQSGTDSQRNSVDRRRISTETNKTPSSPAKPLLRRPRRNRIPVRALLQPKAAQRYAEIMQRGSLLTKYDSAGRPAARWVTVDSNNLTILWNKPTKDQLEAAEKARKLRAESVGQLLIGSATCAGKAFGQLISELQATGLSSKELQEAMQTERSLIERRNKRQSKMQHSYNNLFEFRIGIWKFNSIRMRSLCDIIHIYYGPFHHVYRFRNYLAYENGSLGQPWLCMSIEFIDRSLELVAETEEEITAWFLGVQSLAPLTICYISRGQLLWQRLIMKLNYYGLDGLEDQKTRKNRISAKYKYDDNLKIINKQPHEINHDRNWIAQQSTTNILNTVKPTTSPVTSAVANSENSKASDAASAVASASASASAPVDANPTTKVTETPASVTANAAPAAATCAVANDHKASNNEALCTESKGTDNNSNKVAAEI
jgi:hypothetical protein